MCVCLCGVSLCPLSSSSSSSTPSFVAPGLCFSAFSHSFLFVCSSSPFSSSPSFALKIVSTNREEGAPASEEEGQHAGAKEPLLAQRALRVDRSGVSQGRKAKIKREEEKKRKRRKKRKSGRSKRKGRRTKRKKKPKKEDRGETERQNVEEKKISARR